MPSSSPTSGRTTNQTHAGAPVSQPLSSVYASLRFRTTITVAASQASSFTHQALANAPIFRRSEVKWMSGMVANGSCRLRITCESTSSL